MNNDEIVKRLKKLLRAELRDTKKALKEYAKLQDYGECLRTLGDISTIQFYIRVLDDPEFYLQ